MAQTTWGVIIASGKEEQIAPDTDTAFLSMGSRPVLYHSLHAFEKCPDVDGVIVSVRKERMEDLVGLVQMFGLTKVNKVVAGLASRRTSVQAALRALDPEVGYIVIHEASRPCISEDLVSATLKAAKRHGCGVAAVKITEPVRWVERGQKVVGMPDAKSLWAVQTPQAFKRDLLEKALEAAGKKRTPLADESAALDLIGKPVRIVPGPRTNIRIVSSEELGLVTVLVSQQASLS